MPVRSLSSSVLKWPRRDEVHRAARQWALDATDSHPGVLAIGYIGSYARGDSGPGSDLDVVVVVNAADRPFEYRSAEWDTSSIPVPVDLLIYTRDEFRRITAGDTRFASVLADETCWLVGTASDSDGTGRT